MDAKIILLVEDNPDDAELVRIALQENNVMSQLIVVHSGAEVLDYLSALVPTQCRGLSMMPHLILLDLKLPKVHGLRYYAGCGPITEPHSYPWLFSPPLE